jgi:hypothetical protein
MKNKKVVDELILCLEVVFDQINGDPMAVQFFDADFLKRCKRAIAEARKP